MKKLIAILLFPALALAQPPPITTAPLTVNPSTHVVYPTDGVSGIISDAMAALTNKPSCRLVATSNTTLSGTGGSIDSVTVNAGDLILLAAQSTGSQNGPWVAASGAWTRPTWYASGHTTQAFFNIIVHIRLGTQFIGSFWRISSVPAITIDTTSTTWSQTGLIYGTGVPAFLGVPTSANLAAAITNETGTNALVFNAAPTFTGLVSMQGNLQIGTGTTAPQPLFAVAPVSGPIAMTFKIPGTGDYAQLAYKNSSDAQRGFIGYIGSTFGNPLRRDHFEFGTASGVPIVFRPGDGDGVGFTMDDRSNFLIANIPVAASGTQKTIAFPNTNAPTALPAGTPVGQLYMETGQLKFMNPSGTPVVITP